MKTKLYILLSVTSIFLFSCDGQESSNSLSKEVVINYADLVLANYEDTYSNGLQLQAAVEALVAKPNADALQQAKQAWLEARETYGQTEAFRFYGGPIDDENGPEGQLNAWPLDEAYIDYVSNGVSNNNIIANVEAYPSIDANLIASLNENGSETNVSSGYHAIEFLLWGQDLTDGPGAGQRPYTDYVTDGGGTATMQERRGIYLTEVTELLVNDLSELVQAWDSVQGSYRKNFIATPEQSIKNIVSALGKLSKGELAGERMFVAYDLQSKEDEHSCFSDNTHRDIITNAMGIQNVYLGTYKRINGEVVSGTSIHDLLASKNELLADELKDLITESVAACQEIQPPFDQEIKTVEGRARIAKAISLLRQQGDKFAEAAQVLGFEFDPEDI